MSRFPADRGKECWLMTRGQGVSARPSIKRIPTRATSLEHQSAAHFVRRFIDDLNNQLAGLLVARCCKDELILERTGPFVQPTKEALRLWEAVLVEHLGRLVAQRTILVVKDDQHACWEPIGPLVQFVVWDVNRPKHVRCGVHFGVAQIHKEVEQVVQVSTGNVVLLRSIHCSLQL